jgi:hypothetical protein
MPLLLYFCRREAFLLLLLYRIAVSAVALILALIVRGHPTAVITADADVVGVPALVLAPPVRRAE